MALLAKAERSTGQGPVRLPLDRKTAPELHAAADADQLQLLIMGEEPAAQTTELRLVLSVRDRLHLADVMRTLKRSGRVLRVSRVKP